MIPASGLIFVVLLVVATAGNGGARPRHAATVGLVVAAWRGGECPRGCRCKPVGLNRQQRGLRKRNFEAHEKARPQRAGSSHRGDPSTLSAGCISRGWRAIAN